MTSIQRVFGNNFTGDETEPKQWASTGAAHGRGPRLARVFCRCVYGRHCLGGVGAWGVEPTPPLPCDPPSSPLAPQASRGAPAASARCGTSTTA